MISTTIYTVYIFNNFEWNLIFRTWRSVSFMLKVNTEEIDSKSILSVNQLLYSNSYVDNSRTINIQNVKKMIPRLGLTNLTI